MTTEASTLAVFNDTKIRRVWHENEWWFSVVDVILALEASKDPRNYWKVLKHRLLDEGSQVVTFCNQLKLPAADGKKYDTDCANAHTIFSHCS